MAQTPYPDEFSMDSPVTNHIQDHCISHKANAPNFSRPRPPFQSPVLSHVDFRPPPIEAPDAKRLSQYDRIQPDFRDDDKMVCELEHEPEYRYDDPENYQDELDDEFDLAIPAPISKSTRRPLVERPIREFSAIPPNIARYKQPSQNFDDDDSEHDGTDASSLLTTDTDMTATTNDTYPTADDDASIHSEDSNMTAKFAGRLDDEYRRLSHAEQQRQRWTTPAQRQGNESGSSLSGGNSSLLISQQNTSESSKSILSKPKLAANLSNRRLTKLRPADPNTTSLSRDAASPIVRIISFDRKSERIDPDAQAGILPDGASDKASSKDSWSSSEWKSSDHDIASLTPAQIIKLKKKGINPALYAEMKQARKGGGKKSLINPLTGNTFLG